MLNKVNHKGLHTSFCHKCNKWMEFPYEKDDELYHKQCLIQIEVELNIIKEDITNPFLGRMEIIEHCEEIKTRGTFKPIEIIETTTGNGMGSRI